MTDRYLHETFAGPAIDRALAWHCEPTRCDHLTIDRGRL